MEEEPEPFSEAIGNEDTFDDYIEVPEVVKIPETSSSPEMIGLEADQDDDVEEEKEEELPVISKDEDTEDLRSLETVRCTCIIIMISSLLVVVIVTVSETT